MKNRDWVAWEDLDAPKKKKTKKPMLLYRSVKQDKSKSKSTERKR